MTAAKHRTVQLETRRCTRQARGLQELKVMRANRKNQEA
jgi:hypothetical protein